MLDKPDATSTPTSAPLIKGRRGIREHNSVQSPIDLENPRYYETRSTSSMVERTYESIIPKSPGQSPERSPRGVSEKLLRKKLLNQTGSHDDTESDLTSEGEGSPSDGKSARPSNTEPGSNFAKGCGLAGLAVVGFMLGLYFYEPSAESKALDLHQTFKSLENEFKTQEEDFWRNIKVNIQEIPILDQPRSIIFLYDNKAELTLNKILHKVSTTALCELTYCSNKAVVIEGASLNTSEIVRDYGKTISMYRDSLEQSGVLIVKNLENVPGVAAQAFHSFCDDYNPVVKKALILFTLKVKSIPAGYPMKFVENYLLELWKDLGKDDKFYPLFTRISSTILSVRP